MTTPTINNFPYHDGSPRTRSDWNSLIQTIVNVLTDGTYDLSVNEITATTYSNLPSSKTSGVAGEAISSGNAVRLKASDGLIYKCTSASLEGITGYLGIADDDYSEGATVYAERFKYTSLTGLTAGTTYYLSTDGGISSTAGTYIQVAGFALSSTILIVNPVSNDNSFNTLYINSHFKFDGTTLTALTNNNTTITAYAGKNITIEGIAFDGGVISSVLDFTVDNLNLNGNILSSTSGAVNINPVSGSAVVIDSHFSFDGTTLTALTNNNTIITAYAGKNISIEGVSFDGGVIGLGTNTISDGSLTGAWTGLTSLTVDNINFNSYVVLCNTIGLNIQVTGGNYNPTTRLGVYAANATIDDLSIGLNSYNNSGTITQIDSSNSAWSMNFRTANNSDTDSYITISYTTIAGATSYPFSFGIYGSLTLTCPSGDQTLLLQNDSHGDNIIVRFDAENESGTQRVCNLTWDPDNVYLIQDQAYMNTSVIQVDDGSNSYSLLNTYGLRIDKSTSAYVAYIKNYAADGNGLVITTVNNSSSYGLLELISSAGVEMIVKTDGSVFMASVYGDDINGSTYRDLLIKNDGQLGYDSSTIRKKTNVTDLKDVDWIYNCRPVNFNYKKKDDTGNYTDDFYNESRVGLIAEELEKIASEFVFYDENGLPEGIHYREMIAPIIKAIQNLKSEIKYLKEQNV